MVWVMHMWLSIPTRMQERGPGALRESRACLTSGVLGVLVKHVQMMGERLDVHHRKQSFVKVADGLDAIGLV